MALKIGELYAELGIDDKKFDKDLDKAETKFGNMGTALKTAGKAMGVAAGAAIAAGAVIGMERAKINDKLAASLNLSEGDAQKAGEVAGQVYATGVSDSRTEVSAAVGAIIGELGGIEEAQPDLTKNAIAFAHAFDTDVSEAVGKAGVLMRSDLVADGEEAFDLLTSAMQEVAPSMRDELGDATQEYSRFFGDLGFSGEEMYGLLAAADDKFELDKTGDAIKELSVRASDGSSKTEEAFEAMGLDADKMGKDILAGGDTARGAFDNIVQGLLDMKDPSARAQAAVALFGTPLEDMSSAQIPDFLGSLQNMDGGLKNTEGRAGEMSEQLGDNAAVKIQGFKNKMTNLLSTVVEAPGVLGDATTAIAGIGAVAAPLAPMIGGVAVVFQNQLSSMASKAGSASLRIVKSVGKWAASTVAAGAKATASLALAAGKFVAHYARMAVVAMVNAAKMAASWIIAMGPIAWAIAAVIALVAAVILNWDKVKEYTKIAWEWVSDKITAVWDWVKEKTDTAVAAVVEFVSGLKEDVIGFVQNIVDFIEEYHPIMILWRLAEEWVPKAVQKFLDLKDEAVAKVTALKDRAVEIATTMKTRVIEMFTGLKDRAIEKIEDLVEKAKGIKDTVVDFFSNAGTWLFDAGKNVVQGLIDGIGDMIGSLGEKVSDMVSTVTDYLPLSPAKKGPLSGRGSPDIAGGKVAKMLAEGMSTNLKDVASASAQMAGAASLDLGGVRAPGVRAPGVSGAQAGGVGQDTQVGGVNIENMTVVASDPREFMESLDREIAMRGRARGVRV